MNLVKEEFMTFLKLLNQKNYNFDLGDCINGIEKIEIYAVGNTPSGIEVIGPILDEWDNENL